MTSEEILRLIALPLPALRRKARVPFRTLPSIPAVLEDMADAILAEVRAGARTGHPVRLILPVGPVAHYRRVVEVSNREGLSWRHVHLFAMDEFLDWEGRPVPEDHPLSFGGFLRRELLGRLDRRLRPSADRLVVPHPFRIDEASERIRTVGGIDCCFGGIGYHGHIAFNEPPLSRWGRVSVAELRESRTRVLPLEGALAALEASLQEAARLGGVSLPSPRFELRERNWLVGVRQRLKLELDLRELPPLPGLSLTIGLEPLHPRAVQRAEPLPVARAGPERLLWPLQPGATNALQVHCWRWSPLGLGAVAIALVLPLVLLLQRLRRQLGFGLPELPA